MSTVPPLQSLLDNPRYGELQPDQKVEALRAWEKDEIERRNTSGEWDLDSRANFEVETRRARQAALGIEPQSPEEILKGVIEDENDPEAAQVWEALDEVQAAERDKREINRRRVLPWNREDDDAAKLEAIDGRIVAAKSGVAENEIEQARLGAEALQGKRDAAVVRGKIVLNPELYYDRERYVAAVNSASATPREKARALAGFYRGREETAKAALPKLRGVGAFRSFADTYATENPEATNGDVVEAFRKSGAGDLDKWYESISSGFLSAMEGVGYLGFAAGALQKKLGDAADAVGLESFGAVNRASGNTMQDAMLAGLAETNAAKEFSADRVQTLGGATTAQQYGQVGGQLFGQVALTMLSGPMSSIGKTAASAATKKALAAEVGKKLGVGGLAKKWGKETIQTMFSPAGVIAGASSGGPALYEAYERNRTKLAAEGLTGPELEEAARGEAFVDATRSAVITSTITSMFGLRGVEGIGRLTQVAANPAARAVIKKTAAERWMDVGLGVVTEGVEETLDEGINGGLDALLENPDMTFEDWQKATLFAGSAGALFGGGIEGITNVAEAVAERVKNSPEMAARQQTAQSLRASGLNQTADALEQANVVAESDAVAAAIDEVEARAVGAVERLDAIDTELVDLAKTPGTEARMAELEAERDSLNEALMIGRNAMRNYDPAKTANIAVADVVAEGVEPEEARRRVTEVMNTRYRSKPVTPQILAAQALTAPAPTDTQQTNRPDRGDPVIPLSEQWDRDNRSSRSDEWFEGAHANLGAIEGLRDAATEAPVSAHGLAKEATLTGGLRNLLNLIAEGGVDQSRGRGGLDTAPLAKTSGNSGAGAGTASGSAYLDGPFVVLATDPGVGLITDSSQIGAVLVNEANIGQISEITAAINAVRPDIIVAPYSKAGDVVREMRRPNRASASPAATPTQQTDEKGILQTEANAQAVTPDETSEVTSSAPVSPVTPVKAEPTFRAIAGRPAMVDNEAGDIRIDEDGTVLLDRGPSAPPIIVSRDPDAVLSTSEFNVTLDEETEADVEQARVLRTTIGGRPTPRPIERPKPSSTFVRDDGSIVTSFSGERGPVAAVTDFVSEGETEAGDLFVTVKDRETGSEFELHGDDALAVAVARRDSARDPELTEAVTASIPEPALDFDRVLVRMIGPKANLLAVVDRIGTERIVSQQRLDAALDELTALNTEIENENFPEDIRTRLLGVVDDAFNDIATVRARVRQRPETPADRGTPAPATSLTGGTEETVDPTPAESPASNQITESSLDSPSEPVETGAMPQVESPGMVRRQEALDAGLDRRTADGLGAAADLGNMMRELAARTPEQVRQDHARNFDEGMDRIPAGYQIPGSNAEVFVPEGGQEVLIRRKGGRVEVVAGGPTWSPPGDPKPKQTFKKGSVIATFDSTRALVDRIRGPIPPTNESGTTLPETPAPVVDAVTESAPIRSSTFVERNGDTTSIKWPEQSERWEAGVAWAEANEPGWKGSVGIGWKKGNDPAIKDLLNQRNRVESIRQRAKGKLDDLRANPRRPSREFQFWVGVRDWAEQKSATLSRDISALAPAPVVDAATQSPATEAAISSTPEPFAPPTSTVKTLQGALTDAAPLVERLNDLGVRVVVVKNEQEASTLIEGRPVRKSARGFTSVVDGGPTIVIIESRTKGSTRASLGKFLRHEAVHGAHLAMRRSDSTQNDAALAALLDADPALAAKMDSLYPGYAQLSPQGKLSEIVVKIAEGRLKNNDVPQNFREVIQRLIDYLLGEVAPISPEIRALADAVVKELGLTTSPTTAVEQTPLADDVVETAMAATEGNPAARAELLSAMTPEQRARFETAEEPVVEVTSEPLRYNPANDRHNGERLLPGTNVTDAEGNTYQIRRNSGFILELDRIDENGNPRPFRSISVDPTDTDRFMDVFLAPEPEAPAPETPAAADDFPVDPVPLDASPTGPVNNDAAYLSAVESGDMETAQRMVDEAARAAGTPKKRLARFHDHPDMAQVDARVRGMAQSYKDDGAEEIYFDTNYGGQAYGFSTDGGDAFEINVEAIDSEDSRKTWTDPYRITVKNGPEIKRVSSDLREIDDYRLVASDPVTYDESGNVIPLSQRFNPESNSILEAAPRSRPLDPMFSRHAELEAKNEAGTITPEEIEEARGLVEAAAKQSGYTTGPLLHGTEKDFTEFKEADKPKKTEMFSFGFHFTDSEDLAGRYGKRQIPAFLKVENPLDARRVIGEGDPEWAWLKSIYPKLRGFPNQGREEAYFANELDAVNSRKVRDALRAAGYDALIYQAKFGEMGAYGVTPLSEGETTIVLDPNQIKSAEPFTGVPLSQRFNPESNSILEAAPSNSFTEDSDWQDVTNVLLDRAIAKYPKIPVTKDSNIPAPARTLGLRILVNPEELARYTDGMEVADAAEMIEKIFMHEATHRHAVAEVGDNVVVEYANTMTADERTDVAFKYLHRSAYPSDEAYLKAVTDFAAVDPNLSAGERKVRHYRLGHEAFRMSVERLTSGYTTEETLAFLQTNPGNLQRFIRYLGAYLRRLKEWLRVRKDPAIGVEVKRLARALKTLTKGETVPRGAAPFDPDAVGSGRQLVGLNAGPVKQNLWRLTDGRTEWITDGDPVPVGSTLVRSQMIEENPSDASFARHAELETKNEAGTITPEEIKEAEKIVNQAVRDSGMVRFAKRATRPEDIQERSGARKKWSDKARQILGIRVHPSEIPVVSDRFFRVTDFPESLRDLLDIVQGSKRLSEEQDIWGNDMLELATTPMEKAPWNSLDAALRNKVREDLQRRNAAIERIKERTNGLYSDSEILSLTSDLPTLVDIDTEDRFSVLGYKTETPFVSAEPFTGVPLSQRFNPESDSILETAKVGIFNRPKAKTYVPGGGLTAAYRWDRRVYKMLEAARGEYSGYMKKAEFFVKDIARLSKDLKVAPEAINKALGNTDNRLTQADLDQVKAIKKRGLAAAQGVYLSARNKAKALDAAGMFADAALARQDAKQQFDLDVQTYQRAAATYEARARKAAAAKAYTDRQAAMAALPKPLADVVANLRTEIDLLSARMIAEGDLSAEVQATISNNMELWLHRSYQIFDDPNYVAWIKEQKDPEAIRLRNKTITFLRNDLLTRKIGELMAGGMNRTAATAQAKIEVTDMHVADAFDDYLMVADNGSKTLLTGATVSKEVSALMKRGVIPEEIQELWGRYDDPAVNAAKSIGAIAQHLAIHKFYQDLVKLGVQEQWLKPADADIKRDAQGNRLVELLPNNGMAGRYGTKPKSQYSPLAGYLGPEALKDALAQMVDDRAGHRFIRIFTQLTGYSMASKTVLSWQSGMRNFWGNVLPSMINGNVSFDPRKWGRYKDATEGSLFAQLFGRGSDQTRAYVERATALGVLGDSITDNLIRDLTGGFDSDKKTVGFLGKVIRAKMIGPLFDKSRKAALKVYDVSGKAYNMPDEFWKIVNFEGEKARLRAMLPNETAEQIEVRAAEIVRNTMPTYSRAPEWVKVLRKFPVMAPFITFPAEMVRITLGQGKVGLDFIREGQATGNKKMQQAGYTRLLASGIVAGVVGSIPLVFKAMSDVSTDDEDDLRKHLAPWEKNVTILFLGRNEGDPSKINYLNLSFMNPYDIWLRPWRSFMRGMRDPNADGFGVTAEAAGELVDPIAKEQILFGSLVDSLRGVTATGRKVWDKTDSDFDKAVKSMTHVYNSALEPGTITSIEKIAKAANSEVSVSGRAYNVWQETISAGLGLKANTVDITSTLAYAAKDFRGGRLDSISVFSRAFKSSGTQKDEDIIDAYVETNDKMLRTYRELYEKTVGAVRLGAMTRQEAIQMLRAEDVPADVIGDIMNNRFRRYTPSPDSLQDARRKGEKLGQDRINLYRQALDRVPAVQQISEDTFF